MNEAAPIQGPVKTMFANSGAEAVENAVKISRYATGRNAVIAFEDAFHGRTLLTMTLTSKVMPYKAISPHKAPTVGSAQVIGSGAAAIYARNHGVSVSWSRLQPGFVTSYRIGINPVGLAPGRTWIVLAPTGTRVAAS
jgi:hypothetical protein